MTSYGNYRNRALKVLDWICASCGREFTYSKLHQLEVHHKDHDHTNNPPDGSNWELLCVFCHDEEHSRNETARSMGKAKAGRKVDRSTYKPFADLGKLLDKDE